MEHHTEKIVTEVRTEIPHNLARMSSRDLNRRENYREGDSFYSVNSNVSEGGEPGWIRQQKKAFLRWCNAVLAQRDLAIVTFEEDLKDGIILINLLECLGGKKLPEYTRSPKIKIQMCLNIQTALTWITKWEGLKLNNIGPQDIYEGKTKLILGLIWTLILHFHLQAGRWNKEELLHWVNGALATQGLKVFDFTDSWTDGTAFVALMNYLRERHDQEPLSTVDLTPEAKLNLVFDTAQKDFQIPPLLDAEDMAEPDAQSIMSYISYFRKKDKPKSDAAPKPTTPLPAARSEAATPKQPERTVAPQNTEAEGEGLSSAVCGEPAQFVVKTKDVQKQPLYLSDTQVAAELEKEGKHTTVHIEDKKDGTYLCTYTVNKKGTHDLNITVNDAAVSEKPWKVQAQPGKLSAFASTAQGEGISHAKVGEVAQFVVITRDASDNQLEKGGHQVAATFKRVTTSAPASPSPSASPAPSSEVVVDIKDNNDGSYSASYVPNKHGSYSLDLTCDGQRVKDSPFFVQVSSMGADPKHTTAEGEGLHSATAGSDAEFVITTADPFGNVIYDQNVELKATLKPKKEKENENEKEKEKENEKEKDVAVDLHDQKNGTHNASYHPTKVGEYDLHVTVNGHEIVDSPFTVNVNPGPAKAIKSEAEGDGLKNATSGEPASFTVTVKDQHGNTLSNLEGVTVAGNLQVGPSEDVPCTVEAREGKFHVSYVPKRAGEFPLKVTVNDEDIKGSKFTVKVEAAQSSPQHIEAIGDGIANATAGDSASFFILPLDPFGNAIKDADPTELCLTALLEPKSSPEDAKIPVHISVHPHEVKKEDRKVLGFPAKYEVQKAGDYDLHVTSNGQPIKGSPFPVHIAAGKPSAEHSFAEGEGVEQKSHPISGGKKHFKVHIRDSHGNKTSLQPTQQLTASLSGPSSSSHKNLEGNENEKEQEKEKESEFEFAYDAPNVAGEYVVTVKLDEDNIKDSPFHLQFVAGGLSPEHTVAEGEGLHKARAGDKALFNIIAKDDFGNLVGKGGEAVKATLETEKEQEKEVHVDVEDKGDGVYPAHYVPTKAGKYRLNVTANEKPIKGSPFEVSVVPAETCAGETTCEGSGLSLATVNELAIFYVTARDQFGNPIGHGGLPLIVDIRGQGELEGKHVSANVVDNQDGTYRVEYTPVVNGDYEISVEVATEAKGENEKEHEHGKEKERESENEKAEEQKKAEQKEKEEKAKNAEPAQPKKGSKRRRRNRGRTKGSAEIKQGMEEEKKKMEEEEKAKKEKEEKEKQTKGEREKKPKEEEKKPKKNGIPVKNSPFHVKVEPVKSSHDMTEAEGEGLSKATCGETAHFTVTTKDNSGNKIGKGGAQISCLLKGPEQITATVKDNNDGTYSVSYTPKIAGKFSLDVKDGGEHIKSSPFSVAAQPGPVSPIKTTVSGPGLDKPAAGSKAPFHVVTKDAFGNPLKEGNASVKAELEKEGEGKKNPCEVEDNGDGTYDGHFETEHAGPHLLHVSLGDPSKPVEGSPFRVNVGSSSSLDASQYTASGEGLTKAKAGENASFVVQAKDKYGNPVKVGGDKTLSGGLHAIEDSKEQEKEKEKDKELKASVHDNKDGTYTFTYKLDKSGPYLLDVTAQGQHIKDSPFKLLNEAGPADPHETTAQGKGLSEAVAGVPASFTVQARDSFKNKISPSALPEGSLKAAMVIEDKKPKQSEQKQQTPPKFQLLPISLKPDEESGEFKAEYLPKKSGEYPLRVTLNGKPIRSAPFTVVVSAGEPKTVELEAKPEYEAGKPFDVGLKFKDEFDNPVSDIDLDDVSITLGPEAGLEDSSLKPEKKGDEEGEHVLHFPPIHKSGEFPLDAQSKKNGPFPGSPFKVKINAGEAVDGVLVEPPKNTVIGEEQKVVLQAVDKTGNHVKTGGADVTFQLKGAKTVTVHVQDNKNGTYTGSFKTLQSGKYFLSPQMGDKEIKGSPFAFSVEAGDPSEGHTFAMGEGLENAVAGEAATFFVQSVDSFGNEIKKGGAKITASLQPQSEEGKEKGKEIEAQVEDNNDGIYTVTYVADEGVVHSLDVKLDGKHIRDSPFSVNVVPGKASPEFSSVVEDKVPEAGKPGDNFFKIQAKDKSGNKKKKGGDDVKVVLRKKIERPAEIVDNGDGTYSVKHPYGLEAGDYKVAVSMGGKPMSGPNVPQKVAVEEEKEVLSEEQQADLKKTLPKSAGHVMNFLKSLSPRDRATFLEELQNVRNKEETEGGEKEGEKEVPDRSGLVASLVAHHEEEIEARVAEEETATEKKD